MAALTEYNGVTNYAEFAINDASELDLLPTTTERGKGALDHVLAVSEGSLAFDVQLNPYRLTPAGWVAV